MLKINTDTITYESIAVMEGIWPHPSPQAGQGVELARSNLLSQDGEGGKA